MVEHTDTWRVFKKGGTPVAGWLIMENPIDMDDFFFRPFCLLRPRVTPIVGTHQINLCVKCKCVCVCIHTWPTMAIGTQREEEHMK